MELTRSELEIMDVLWQEGCPLSRADILARPENKSWKDSSVHILLNGLLNKGAIREAGFVKCSKTYGRTFEPTMTREEYYAAMIFSRRCKPRLPELMEALLKRPEADEKALASIAELVNKTRETR